MKSNYKYNNLTEIYYAEKADELSSNTNRKTKYDTLFHDFITKNHIGRYFKIQVVHDDVFTLLYPENDHIIDYEEYLYIFISECTEKSVGLEICICIFGLSTNVTADVIFRKKWVSIEEYMKYMESAYMIEISINEYMIAYVNFQRKCNDLILGVYSENINV